MLCKMGREKLEKEWKKVVTEQVRSWVWEEVLQQSPPSNFSASDMLSSGWHQLGHYPKICESLAVRRGISSKKDTVHCPSLRRKSLVQNFNLSGMH